MELPVVRSRDGNFAFRHTEGQISLAILQNVHPISLVGALAYSEIPHDGGSLNWAFGQSVKLMSSSNKPPNTFVVNEHKKPSEDKQKQARSDQPEVHAAIFDLDGQDQLMAVE